MITPELLGFVRSELAKGRTRQAIHDDLISGGGWKPEDVDEAFKEIAPAPITPPPAPMPAPAPVQPILEPVAPVAVVHPEPVIVHIPEVAAPVFPPNLPIEPVHTVPPEPLHHLQPIQPEPIAPIIYPTTPVQPIIQPVMQPVMPSVVQSVAEPAPASDTSSVQDTMSHPVVEPPVPVAEKPKPYILWSLLCILFSAVLFIVLVFMNKPVVALLGSLIGFIIPLVIIFIGIGILLGSWILHLATKLFKSIQSSWHKALFASSMIGVISAVLAAIEAVGHFPLSIVILLSLLGFGLQLTVLTETYHISALKAFALGLVQGLLILVVIGVIAIIAGILSSSLHKAQQPTVYQNMGTPSTTAYPTTTN